MTHASPPPLQQQHQWVHMQQHHPRHPAPPAMDTPPSQSDEHHLAAMHHHLEHQLSLQGRSQFAPHPPTAPASLATHGRAHRRTQAHPSSSSQPPPAHAAAHPSPAAVPAAAPPAPSAAPLPYHRKRLLELVDPSTYSDVLAATARQLGVNLAAEPHSRWVVEALFLAPLPQGVVRCHDAGGNTYYFDRNTNKSSWVHPCAKQFEALLRRAQESPSSAPSSSPAAVAVAAGEESKTNDAEPIAGMNGTAAATATSPSAPTTSSAPLAATPSPSPSAADANPTSAASGIPTTATATATATAAPHKPPPSKTFLRANAGLSSTSSLFLTEEELAHWAESGEDELDPDPAAQTKSSAFMQGGAGRNGNASSAPQRRQWHGGGRASATSDAPIDDEFGGMDGERWRGEDGFEAAEDAEWNWQEQQEQEELQRQLDGQRAHRPAHRNASRASNRKSRPTSSYSSFSAAAPIPWSNAQPPLFHPWVSAGGVGDTEYIIPAQGSLLAPTPAAASASASTTTSSGHARSRPASGVRLGGGAISRERGASASSFSAADGPLGLVGLVSASSRLAHSQHVREAHKRTRSYINHTLRARSSQLISARQNLQSLLRSLQRLVQGSLGEEERLWRDQRASLHSFASLTAQRVESFRDARPMLDEAAAAELEHMLLHRTGAEVHASRGRIEAAMDECADVKAEAQQLVREVQAHVDSASESLRVDAQCLELARSGVLGAAADTTAAAAGSSPYGSPPPHGPIPPLSLPACEVLLARVHSFLSHARELHAVWTARREREKHRFQELMKANALLLRRGLQQACERRGETQAALLANRALIPSLTAQVRELHSQLAAQRGPLAVCQRTYELQGASSSSSPSGDASGDASPVDSELLHRLADELAALGGLVRHLETGLAQAQGQLDEVHQLDRLRGAELSTEEMRIKFYQTLLAMQPSRPPSAATGAGGRSGSAQQRRSVEEEERAHRATGPQGQRNEEATETYRADQQQQLQQLHPYSLQQGHSQGSSHAAVASAPRSRFRPASSRPAPLADHRVQVRAAPSALSTRPVSACYPRPFGSPALPAAPAPAALAPSSPELLHSRNQLLRDHAANLERLRTRKVRRAKVTAGAAYKNDIMMPSAGRPVFEGRRAGGYDS